MRYRYTGEIAQSFPGLGLDLEPGQEFETFQIINHPDIQLVEEPAAKVAAEE